MCEVCVCVGGKVRVELEVGSRAGYLQCVLKTMDQLNWWKDDPEEQLNAGAKLKAEAQLDVGAPLGEQTLCPTWLV